MIISQDMENGKAMYTIKKAKEWNKKDTAQQNRNSVFDDWLIQRIPQQQLRLPEQRP
jgi:hypothetical protein